VVFGCSRKAEARVILRVSQNDDEGAAGLAQVFKSIPDKLRS
jgi:hypothetical protein